MHVHVNCANGEAKFWLEPELQLAYNHKLSRNQLREAEQIIDEHFEEITMPGVSTSEIEVTHISKHGLWLFVGNEELFLSFEDFPWFKDAPVKDILHVEEPSAGHYFWPALDVDLSLEIIRTPSRFPLKARMSR